MAAPSDALLGTPNALPARPAWRGWLCGLLLIALPLGAFLPALHGGYVLDDDLYVTTNPTLRSVDGLRRIWFEIGAEPDYYTLVVTSFWLEYHLWGLAPLGYHAVNIMLHAASALLLWRLLLRLRVPGAWLAAAVFAVHPVCVESTAWVTERKNTLSMFFALAAMLCYLRFEPAEVPLVAAQSGRRNWRLYLLALVLFAAALFSKTAVVALPAVLLVVYWWKRGSISWRTAAPLVPMFLLALGTAAVTIGVETYLNGAHGTDWRFTPLERLLIAGRALWFYAGKLVWPHPLAFMYPRWTIDTHAAWQYLYPLLAVATLILLWLARGKIGRGPLAATLIYCGVLFPVLGFFNTCYMRYYFVADHLQYQASVALIALIIAAAWTITTSYRWQSVRRLTAGTAAVLLGTFMVLSWQQCLLYADSLTLNQDVLKKNPDSWLAHHNLGVALIDTSHYQEAVEQYHEALRLRPNFPEAENDLGYAMLILGNAPQAEEHFRAALRLKPDYAEAYNNLGNVLKQSGQLHEAIEQYEAALRVNRKSFEAHNNLGSVLRQCGRLPEAIDHYQQALRLEPDQPVVHNNLANALLVCNRVPEAINHYQEALRLQPDFLDAHLHLAMAYAQSHRLEDAIAAGEKALRLARSSGQTQPAQQIEAWLTARRASLAARGDLSVPR